MNLNKTALKRPALVSRRSKPSLNRVFCGDFLEAAKLLPENLKFDIVIADPPYNIGKDFGGGSGKDSLPLADYLKWTDEWLSVCFSLLKDNGLIYLYGFPEILSHTAVRRPLQNQRWLVWHYTNKTVPGLKFWQRSHESILCLWKGRRPPLQIDQIREDYTDHYKKCIGKPRRETKGRYNRNGVQTVYNGHEKGALPRDVLKIPALAGGAGRQERWFLCRDCRNEVFPPGKLSKHRDCNILKHPTQKPLRLTKRLLLSCVNGAPARALIPFAGSGSECVAARSLGIDFFACETNKEYVLFAKQWLKSLLCPQKHVIIQKMRVFLESSGF